MYTFKVYIHFERLTREVQEESVSLSLTVTNERVRVTGYKTSWCFYREDCLQQALQQLVIRRARRLVGIVCDGMSIYGGNVP